MSHVHKGFWALVAATLVGLAVILLPAKPAAAAETTNVDYLAEAAIRQLAEGWDTSRIAPLFAEAHRAELQSDAVRASLKPLSDLGPVKAVSEQFRTFSTMSQFSMGIGQTTRSYATRAYWVEITGGAAKVSVAMVGDGRNTDITVMSIRKMMPPPTAQVTLGKPDAHVWSQFEQW
jgi:hypothetical protein